VSTTAWIQEQLLTTAWMQGYDPKDGEVESRLEQRSRAMHGAIAESPESFNQGNVLERSVDNSAAVVWRSNKIT